MQKFNCSKFVPGCQWHDRFIRLTIKQSNPQPLACKSDAVCVAPPGHPTARNYPKSTDSARAT